MESGAEYGEVMKDPPKFRKTKYNNKYIPPKHKRVKITQEEIDQAKKDFLSTGGKVTRIEPATTHVRKTDKGETNDELE